MSFTDDLKRSLGFEETDSGENNVKNELSNIVDSIRDVLKPKEVACIEFPPSIAA